MKKVVGIVIAMALMISSFAVTNVTTAQAAVKLNKKTVSINAGDTFQLKLSGAKAVTWSSSNKKIATVTSKGKVKGIKKGNCTITAKNKKTKKSYKCKVSVRELRSLGLKADDIALFPSGDVIEYPGNELEGVTYVLDGKTLGAQDYTMIDGENDDGIIRTLLQLKERLSEGDHTFSITKKGYKTITVKLTYEPVEVSGMFASDPFVKDGQLWLRCTPDLDGKKFAITVDGAPVEPSIDAGINGDGIYLMLVDVSALSKGTHKVEVKADGMSDGVAEFTI